MAAKVVTATFFCTQILPQVAGLSSAVTAGAGVLYAMTDQMLGA